MLTFKQTILLNKHYYNFKYIVIISIKLASERNHFKILPTLSGLRDMKNSQTVF